MDTTWWAGRAPTPGNDVAAQNNKQAVYVVNENYRSLLRKAKHQRKLLKDYFNHMGVLAGQRRELQKKGPRQKEVTLKQRLLNERQEHHSPFTHMAHD